MTSENIKILIVDDEERLLDAMSKGLSAMDYSVTACRTGGEAVDALCNSDFDVMITDLVMPGMDGMQVLEAASERKPEVPVIILTGHGSIPNAVQAMQKGAFNYITKPYNLDEVDVILKRAAEHRRLVAENMMLREQVESRPSFAGIIGESNAMQKVYKIIDRVKDTRSTLLITGESGTGKELAAKAVHYSGTLRDRPFVTVDCGSLTETLLESELFGHVRGAFTGAHRDHEGYFSAADSGTIFLDEIGEFSPNLQTRLLRVLQEGEFSRVGDNKTRKAEVRVIAATNRDLSLAVQKGTFREDLYYRLNVITIHMPSLRDRREDIQALIKYFLDKFNAKLGKNILGISPEAAVVLNSYTWPGNVRELENMMERIVTFCDGEFIEPDVLPDNILEEVCETSDAMRNPGTGGMKTYKDAKSEIVGRFTRDYLEALMRECEGSIKNASLVSGMDRTCLYRLMRKHGISKGDIEDF